MHTWHVATGIGECQMLAGMGQVRLGGLGNKGKSTMGSMK